MCKPICLVPTALLLALSNGILAGQTTWRDVVDQATASGVSLMVPGEYAGIRGNPCAYETPSRLLLISGLDAGFDGMLSLPYEENGLIRMMRVAEPSAADTVSVSVVEARCSSRPAGELSSMVLDLHGSALLYEGPGYSFFRVEAPDGSIDGLTYNADLRQTLTFGEAEERTRAEREAAAERERLAAEAAARERRERIRARGWSQRAVNAVMEGSIYLGMNAEMVRESWGTPLDINRTISAAGVTEQWVYGSGSYVYFDNGVVSTIQN